MLQARERGNREQNRAFVTHVKQRGPKSDESCVKSDPSGWPPSSAGLHHRQKRVSGHQKLTISNIKIKLNVSTILRGRQ